MDCIGFVIRRTDDSASGNGEDGYVEKHGHHFTDALADHAVSLMQNRDGSSHRWSATQVRDTIRDAGLYPSGRPGITDGDLAFAANMAYADFYPSPLASETDCLRYAVALAEDPDGYEGMIFDRWLADVRGRELRIDWDAFT